MKHSSTPIKVCSRSLNPCFKISEPLCCPSFSNKSSTPGYRSQCLGRIFKFMMFRLYTNAFASPEIECRHFYSCSPSFDHHPLDRGKWFIFSNQHLCENLFPLRRKEHSVQRGINLLLPSKIPCPSFLPNPLKSANYPSPAF